MNVCVYVYVLFVCFIKFSPCIVEKQLANKPCFINKEWCLVLCDFQGLNYFAIDHVT